MARASKTSCDAEKNASWNNHDKQWKVANTFLSDVIVTAQTVVVSWVIDGRREKYFRSQYQILP